MKNLSKREQILLVILGILVIVLLYYYAFYIPTKNKIATLNEDLVKLEETTKLTDEKVAKMEEMKAELEKIKQSGVENIKEVPPYDNRQKLMSELSVILSKAEAYAVSFEEITSDGITISRNVRLDCTCSSYATTKAILQEIYNGKYPCTFKDVFLGEDGTTLTVDIIFFEYGTLKETTM